MLGTPSSFFFSLSKKSINNFYWGLLRQLQTWWGWVSPVRKGLFRLMMWQDWKVWRAQTQVVFIVSATHSPQNPFPSLASSCGIYSSENSVNAFCTVVVSFCVHWGWGHVLFPSGGCSLWFWQVKEVTQERIHVAHRCAWEQMDKLLLNLPAGCASRRAWASS